MDDDADCISDSEVSRSIYNNNENISGHSKSQPSVFQHPSPSTSRHSYLGHTARDGEAPSNFLRSKPGISKKRSTSPENDERDINELSEYSDADVQNMSSNLGNEDISETSFDADTSFSTSIVSERGSKSSSVLSVDPVVWKKFKFLSSILKETQHNLRAMDDMILEHRRIQDQNFQMAFKSPLSCSHLSVTDNQKLGECEPKTDEAKLEEILGLLHNLTATLTSYEQHPLLASALQMAEVPKSNPELSLHVHHISPSMGAKDYRKQPPDNHERFQYIPHTSSQNPLPSTSNSQAYTSNFQPSTSNFQPLYQEASHSTAIQEYPEVFHGGRNSVHSVASSDIVGPCTAKEPPYDTEEKSKHVTYHSAPYSATQVVYADSNYKQSHETQSHPLTKETTSLRKNIDDIVVRKQALDSRLQSLIAYRASQKVKECQESVTGYERRGSLVRSHSLEEVEDRKSKSHWKKNKTRSKSHDSQYCQNGSSGSSVRDAYLSMISEDRDEFPSLVMGSFENDERISELRNDEADLPGLGDSGLSSEINSISATIQELIKENQRLHRFLQGMTSESMAKVDQQKLELQAQIQSLNEENLSLRMAIGGEETGEEVSKSDTTPKQHDKTVTFSNDENREHVIETQKVTNMFIYDQEEIKDGPLSNKLSKFSSSKQNSFISCEEKTAKEEFDTAPMKELINRIKTLETEVERLTNQNRDLMCDKTVKTEMDIQTPTETAGSNNNKEDWLSGLDNLDENNLHHSESEIELLKEKMKKLVEEKTMLEFKLNNEVTERDLESSRLEARIRILTEQNKTLTESLLKHKSSFQIFKGYENISFVDVCVGTCDDDDDAVLSRINTSSKPFNASLPDHIMPSGYQDKARIKETVIFNIQSTRQSSLDQLNGVSQNGRAGMAGINEDVSGEQMGSRRNFIFNEDILEENIKDQNIPDENKNQYILREKNEDVNVFNNDENINVSNKPEYILERGNEKTVKVSHESNNLMEGEKLRLYEARSNDNELGHQTNITHDESSNDAFVPTTSLDSEARNNNLSKQLETLLKQTEKLIEGFTVIQNSTKTSESYLESTLAKMLGEHSALMKDIDKRLSVKSTERQEFELEISKLIKEKQELMCDLDKKQYKIEALTNQNSSLEKKIELSKKTSSARDNKGSNAVDNKTTSDSDDTSLDENSSTPEFSSREQNTEQNHRQMRTDKASREIFSIRKYGNTDGLGVITPKAAEETLQKDDVRRTSLSDDSSPQTHTRIHSHTPSSPKTSRNSVSDIESSKEKFEKERERLKKLLEKADTEKQNLRDRIAVLVSENDCIAARLEEIVGVSQNLNEQLSKSREHVLRVTADKEDLQKRVKLLEEGREDSSLSLSDSGASTRLTQRLRDRIRHLQGEIEGAWQEVHVRTLERDKVQAERESLEYTSGIAVSTVKKEVDSLKSQLATLERELEKRYVDLANTKNELEKKSVELGAAQEDMVSHRVKLKEAETKIEELVSISATSKEELAKEVFERKIIESQLEESMQRKPSSPRPSSQPSSYQLNHRGERQWLDIITQLKSKLYEEQLRARLLEAADRESSARILVLQHNVREAIESYENLQAKYKQLRTAYRAKKSDKTTRKEFSQQYSTQMQELSKTSDALEDTYKVMLSTLGENIEVAVEILTSHVFLSPCMIHPGPDLRMNPDSWFESQLGRLRWLQTQLRKLCLHNWKSADLPRTSNLDSVLVDNFPVSQGGSQIKQATFSYSECNEKSQKHRTSSASSSPVRYVKKNTLNELSILDESRSYPSSPVKQRTLSSNPLASAYSMNFSFAPKFKSSAVSDTRVEVVGDFGTSQTKSKFANDSVTIRPHVRESGFQAVKVQKPDRKLSAKQHQLSEVKYKQYRAIVTSLQRDLECPSEVSPSLPSSMITTPEDAVSQNNSYSDEGQSGSVKTNTDGEDIEEASSSKTLVSPTSSRTNSAANNISLNLKYLSGGEKITSSSSSSTTQHTPKSGAFTTELLKEERESSSSSSSSTTQHMPRSAAFTPELLKEEQESLVVISSTLIFEKENRPKTEADSEKDRDSFEAGSDDVIRAFVEKEDGNSLDSD
ncbi:hypothetical protein SK128_005712 [Halocaridina rubra]|uniref:Uncharacterized protein n=1 Tax=Halocaridina rubra TaxID=373956 RepID=A0AAN8XAS9_HALRR